MLKLVAEKAKLHRSSTVVLSIFLFILSMLIIFEPLIPGLAGVLGPDLYPKVVAGVSMLIAAGRYIVQTSLKGMVVEVSDEIPKEEEEK